MSVKEGNYPVQVSETPRCPKCQSTVGRPYSSKRIEIEHKGQKWTAQKQYRQCCECNTSFGTIKLKEPIPTKKRHVSGPWAMV